MATDNVSERPPMPDLTSPRVGWALPLVAAGLGIFIGSRLVDSPDAFTVIGWAAVGAIVGTTVSFLHRRDVERRLQEAITAIRAISDENETLRHRLAATSFEDPETHLTHRDYGLRRLTESFAVALRHGFPLSVVLVQVEPSDASTMHPIASRIRAALRAGDICSRFDEKRLMIVAPATDRQDSVLMGFRLLRTLAKREILGDATISMSVASWPTISVKTAGELISLAEAALMKALEEPGHNIATHRGDAIDLHHAEAVLEEAEEHVA